MKYKLNKIKINSNLNDRKKRLSKIVLIAIYLGVWLFSIISFWAFRGQIDAMSYSIIYLWILIPITTFIISILIGKKWGKYKWFMSILFGIMYMLSEYATFNTANMLAFNKINSVELTMIPIGTIISLIGMIIGYNINKFNPNLK